MTHPISANRGGEVGDLLRHWRKLRGRSQFDLALAANVSQRHVSFVENGRSGPSRELLIKLARTLDIPLRERNRLLLAAGFAPAYAERPFDADTLDAVSKALDRVLRQHEPFPAVVLDRYWHVLRANDAAPRFFGSFVDLSAWPRPRNLLRLMFDPAGMRPLIANWSEASESLIERVRQEAVGGVLDDETNELIRELEAYGGQTATRPSTDAGIDQTVTSPVIPLRFQWKEHVLSYFSMVTTVGTPSTVAAQEFRIECMYPLDDDTERQHLALLAMQRPSLPRA